PPTAYSLPPYSLPRPFRHIGTERVAAQRVAGSGIGAGARAATDTPERADAALAFEPVGVTQPHKERVMPVDIHQRIAAPHIARGQGQKAAGINLSCMRDKDNAIAVADAKAAAHRAGDDRF